MEDSAGPAGAAPAAWGYWLVAGLSLVLCLPILLCDYLPAIDLPQHVAIASILKHYADPRYGFTEHYVPRTETLYILPYVLTLWLGKVLPLKRALYAVVFLATLLLPLGVTYVCRAQRRPAQLALLALPLTYNSMFFWGFFSFQLAMGLALFCIGLLLHPRLNLWRQVLLAALGVAITYTHIYGLLFLLGFVALWALFSDGAERARLRRWALPLLPAVLGALRWIPEMRGAAQAGTYGWEPAWFRIQFFPRQILGGYQDSTEAVLLVLALMLLGLFAWADAPVSRARFRALPAASRVFYVYAALNLGLYFVLPLSTPTAKVLNPRHAVLGAVLLPLCLNGVRLVSSLRLSRVLLGILVVTTLLNAWGHLLLFDREARSFDKVIAALPERPRILQLNRNAYGEIMANYPYVHFAAYAQAEKGGMLAVTFPRVFWNVPVGWRGQGVPPTPSNLDIQASLFDFQRFGYYYDTVLVRTSQPRVIRPSPEFPYEAVLREGPWQVYRLKAPAAPGPAAR